MRAKVAIAALAVIVAVLGVGIALSGSSSRHSGQVVATAAPAAASPSPPVSPPPSATHLPLLRRAPGPTRPTIHIAPAPAGTHPAVAGCRLAAGMQTMGGRSVILDLPIRFPASVVIDYHGGNQSAAQEHGYTGLGAAGTSRGFAVVTPDGTNGLWNFSGAEPLPDDAAFTRTIADTLAIAGCSNGKLYTAGISDGADMAVAAACRIGQVRAVFAVAPSITPRGTCLKKPFVEVHGTADPIVPYDRSAAGSFGDVPSEPVASRLRFWTSGCTGPVDAIAAAATHVQRWSCGGGRSVELFTVNGGGHAWPGAAGSPPVAGLGARARWSADFAALDFFAAH